MPDLRTIFLQPRATYSLAEVAQLTGFALADLAAGTSEMTWEDLVALVLIEWPLPTIHEALGTGVTVLPALLQPDALTIRLLRYQVLALGVLARELAMSVDALVSDYLVDALNDNEDLFGEHVPAYR